MFKLIYYLRNIFFNVIIIQEGSNMEHWVYTTSLFGHSVSFNVDTILTMWISMFLLIILALLTTKKLDMVPTKLQFIGKV